MQKRKISLAIRVKKLRQWLRRAHWKFRGFFRKQLSGELRLANTPDHLLSAANPETGSVRIDAMDRRAYQKSVFLDGNRPGDFYAAKGGLWAVNLKELPGLADCIGSTPN
jgi:hypothetical protein